jgi:hypothetical protein
MSEVSLDSALNDCIDQLAAGRSVNECLRLYPQHSAELRPMLEAGLLARRAQYNALEVSTAQNRTRPRVVAAMMGQAAPVRRASYSGWLRVAALFLIVFVVVLGIAGGSEGSLPGDPLYPVKRLTESAQLLFGDGAVLREQFARRRIDEINTLLAQGREAEVEFQGEVEAVSGDIWRIAGLPVRVPPGTPGIADAQPGDHVKVRASTTPARELVATNITLLEDRTLVFTPTQMPPDTSTPSATPTPTIAATQTPTLTRTLTPDNDRDGLPDSADLCPTVPGAVVASGCPLLTATTVPLHPSATFAPPPSSPEGDDDDNGNSGPGGGDDDGGDDNSGPGGGDDDNSGPGGG